MYSDLYKLPKLCNVEIYMQFVYVQVLKILRCRSLSLSLYIIRCFLVRKRTLGCLPVTDMGDAFRSGRAAHSQEDISSDPE